MALNSGVGFLERTQSVGSPPSELVDGHTWFYEVLSPYFMHSVLICTNFNTISCLYIMEYVQRDRTQRALLQYQNFYFLFYLGWSGSFPQTKHNIMKVVQS